jgi:hypothetical protein
VFYILSSEKQLQIYWVQTMTIITY